MLYFRVTARSLKLKWNLGLRELDLRKKWRHRASMAPKVPTSAPTPMPEIPMFVHATTETVMPPTSRSTFER